MVRLLQNALLAALSLAVGLCLGEVLVRVVAPQQLILKRPDVWEPVDSLGWKRRAEVHTTINTGERTVSLFTDGQGHRVGANGRSEAGTKVLILGDSMLEAVQVEYEASIPGLLEDELGASLGRPVAVRNTAVGGWSPSHYLIQARRSLAEEEFDLALVFVYLGNDIQYTRFSALEPRVPKEVHSLRLPRSLAWRELVDALLYPANDFLEVRSHAFILAKNRAASLLMRFGLAAAAFPPVLKVSEAHATRWRTTAEICADIAQAAERHRTPLLFVFLPAPVQVDADMLGSQMEALAIPADSVDIDQPNRLLGREFDERGLPFIDATSTLREARSGNPPLYGEVDSHLSPAGHRVVTRFIEPYVRALLACDGCPPTDGSVTGVLATPGGLPDLATSGSAPSP